MLSGYEGIACVLMSTPEKTITYSNSYWHYSTQFGPNELSIGSTSGINNENMAVLCAMLSDAAYTNAGLELAKMYQQMFKGTDADTIFDYKGDAFCSGIALGEMNIDGQETNVLVITVRGTQNLMSNEVWADISSSKTNLWGNETYSAISDFMYNVLADLDTLLARHPEFADNPYKIIVTGHSLGGAAANLIAALFTQNLNDYSNRSWSAIAASQSDIYCYTYGAIDALGTRGNVLPIAVGYENIHNIVNTYDNVIHSSDYIRNFETQGEGKYGHMDYFSQNNQGNPSETHNMYRYLDAVATDQVNEYQM